MTLTQCKGCDEWCEGEYCSDECQQYVEQRRDQRL